MMNPAITLGWLAIALIFWIANVILHLDFSNWLTTQYETTSGIVIPLDYRIEAAGVASIILITILSRQFYKGENHKLTILYWTIWLLTSYGIAIFLITTNLELIHFLQYGALSYLLAMAIDRDRTAWPLVTLSLLTLALGMIDELNQYFFLTPSNSVHMDFNDFFLNLQGAAGGLLFFYGFRYPTLRHYPGHRLWLVNTLVLYVIGILAIIVLIGSGTLLYTPDHAVPPGGIDYIDGSLRIYLQREANLLGSWNTSFSAGQYYILSAAEGFAILVIATGVYSGYGYFSQKLKPKTETKTRSEKIHNCTN